VNRNAWWRNGFIIILLIAALTRFWDLRAVPYVIFDEVFNTSIAARYIAGEAFVDGHPPTARLHFATAAWIGGATKEQQAFSILQPYNNFPYVLMRSVSATAGVLLVAFCMLLMKKLTNSPGTALLAGLFITLDNALVLYSRLILPDTLLLLYGIAGLYCYFKKDDYPTKSKYWYVWLIAGSILFGLTINVKITALWFPFIALLHSLVHPFKQNLRESYTMAIYLFGIPIIITLLLFILHFSILEPTGTVYYASTDIEVDMFNQVREGNPIYKISHSLGLVTQRIAEAVIGFLYTVEVHFVTSQQEAKTATASYSWQWLLMQKPMTFAVMPTGETTRFIYLIGNPIIWWGVIVAVIARFVAIIKTRHYKKIDILLIGYIGYLAVFTLISRPMFIYHYFPSLIFGILLLASAIIHLHQRWPWLSYLYITLVIASFVFLSPYSYGLPLTERQLSRRTFLNWNPLNDKHLRQQDQIKQETPK
jgi:dolichyl-phosphate-mannose-protein mannosyltransferase